MINKITCGIFLILLSIGILTFALDIQPVRTDSATIIVPDDYSTINAAITHANPLDTIFVRNGTYHEHLYIDKPIFLTGKDKNTTIIDGNGFGNVVFIESYNVRLFNFTIRNGNIGLYIRNSGSIILRDNNFQENKYNFVITGGSFISDWIQDIDTSNLLDGKPMYYWVNEHDKQVPADAGSVTIVGSSNITVRNLNLTKVGTGVLMLFTNYSLVENVRACGNYYTGVSLYNSNHNVVRNNLITQNGYRGIVLWFDLAYNNLIYNNTVADNGWAYGAFGYGGIVSQESSGNIIFHNNLLHNKIQANAGGYANVWDNGSEGNYWSNYDGTDLDEDGIGDTPFIIDYNNRDNYPLMQPKPYPLDLHEIGITHLGASKTVVEQSCLLDIIVTIFNYGDNTEHFNVTVYANTTVLQTFEDITLTSRNSTTMTLTWNTTYFAKGNYAISAVADAVLGEIDTADNTCIDDWVFVTIPGDVNGDRKVDMRDISAQGRAFGATAASPNWDANADINNDGKVDYRDLGIAARNLGKYW